jgi:pyridoxamine 5'-phosphate oxidase
VKPTKDLKQGQKVEDLNDPVARENFRVVIIKPDEVEQVDLTDPKGAKRFLYTFTPGTPGSTKEEGEWHTAELWP